MSVCNSESVYRSLISFYCILRNTVFYLASVRIICILISEAECPVSVFIGRNHLTVSDTAAVCYQVNCDIFRTDLILVVSIVPEYQARHCNLVGHRCLRRCIGVDDAVA